MPIFLAKHAGFCKGVSRAVRTAENQAQKVSAKGGKVYTLGELIHNPSVIARLGEQGVHAVSSPEEARDGVLIIRSHGVGPETLEKSKRFAPEVVDCTCPFVHHVHQLVHSFSQDGSAVIVLGDQEHPEIKGILAWCQGPSWVVAHEDDLARLPDKLEGAMLVSQTTFPPADYDRLSTLLKAKYVDLRCECTICKATSQRQAETESLAKTMDRMLVVGGKHSANTRKLAETSQKWCKHTHLVESAEELQGIPMNPAIENIGITAGASTPAWSLKEVVDFMNDMEQKGLDLTPNPEDVQAELETVTEAVEEKAAEAVAEAAEEAVAEAEAVTESAVEASTEAVEDAAELVAEVTAEADEVVEAAVDAVEETAEAVESEASPATEAVAEVASPAPSFMDEVAASMTRIRPGQTISGKIIQITEDEVSVNIGYKSDGLLKKSDMVDMEAQLGDEIEVEVIKVNDGEGNVILSQRNIVNRKVWAELVEKYEAGELVDGIGKEAVKGGLLADVEGVRAFIPASHLAQRFVEKISQFVGQEMKLKIIEVDNSKKRIVASRKEALAQEMEAVKEAVWSQLVEGEVITGVVRRFTNFGAFVDLGGVDGLIHVSDLSWNRNVNPSDVLSANQEVNVVVLSLDRERERIALGYKQLQARPWDNVEEKYPVGEILTRRIVRVRPFGAFVELEPGVDGLVHISQVAHSHVERIEDVIQPGQEVNVKVLAVDPVAKRISLSIREAQEYSAVHYKAEVPGEAGFETEIDSYRVEDQPYMDSYSNQPSERPETALELAMRKAREIAESREAEEGEE